MGWWERMLSESSIHFLLPSQKAWAWGFQLVERSSRRMGESFGPHRTRTMERQYTLPFDQGSPVEPKTWRLYESISTDNSTYRRTRTTRSTRPFLLDLRESRRALRGRHSIYTDRARSWRKMHLHSRRWHGGGRSRSHAIRR